MRIIKNNLFMMGYIWKYNKSMLFLKFIIATFNAIYVFIDVYFIKWIFEALDSKESMSLLLATITIAGALHLSINCISAFYSNVLQPKMSLVVSEKINAEMISKAQVLDLSCYENPSFYDKYTRALSETDGRINAVLNSFGMIISSILTVSVIVSLVATIDITFILLGILASASVFLQGLILNKVSFEENQKRTPHNRQQAYIKQVIYQADYAKELKLYPSLADVLKNKFSNEKKELVKIVKDFGSKKAKVSLIFSAFRLAFENILPWSIIVLKTFSGAITLGSAAAVFNAASQLPYALNGLLNIIPQMHQHSLYIDNLREIIDFKSNIESDYAGQEYTETFSEIIFQNVSFSYPDSKTKVLENISLTICKGQKIALVGENGSGKSTLIKLLARLYDPTEGQILLNNQNIKTYRASEYRKIFGFCFQDYEIYAMTIAENVLMRRPRGKQDFERVEVALKQVGMLNKIQKLPKYLNTTLTKEFDNSGVILSGGEIQRLALARALASDASIIVLDEPLSSLDPIAEKEINQIILQIASKKTVVFISHRLSTTIDADMIYHIENGQIVEQGSHRELIKSSGKYADMFNAQTETSLHPKAHAF